MATNIKQLGDQLIELTLKEVQELAAYLKDTYNIEPSQVGVQYKFIAPGDSGTPVEKNTFDVVLKSPGANKLQIVRLVKDLTGLGLKEAKDLVEAAPKIIKEGLPKVEAENIRKQLIDGGADVDVK